MPYNLKLIQAANELENFTSAIPTLGLAMLAAVTPSNYNIEIVDERIEHNNLDDHPDIVGISFECCRLKRALSIASHYRKRGIPVVFGGVYATADPESIKDQCDALVIGEAEELWPALLKDFEKGKLKKVYKQNTPVDLSRLPSPRTDLIMAKYPWKLLWPVEATRGCIHNCQYCFSKVINPTFRKFPVEKVVKECKEAKAKILVFMDDNFTVDRNHAIELLKKLKPLKKKIIFQANLDIGKDLELLRHMKEAGVAVIFAGMESINEDSLRSVNKGFNRVEEYEQCIKNLQNHAITVRLGLIFGLDKDTKDIFKRTFEFLEGKNILGVTPNFLIPYPGTEYYQMLAKQGRILHEDYDKYDGTCLIVKPTGMTVEELQEGYDWFIKSFYNTRRILKKMLNSFFKSPWATLISGGKALGYYRHYVKRRRKFVKRGQVCS